MPSWLFGDGEIILRTFVVGIASYVSLLIILRTSGQRTLAKMNAFDFVVTIALGSGLASVLTSDAPNLARAVTIFVVLIGMQFLLTLAASRSGWARRIITGEPKLLASDGRMLEPAARRARVGRADLEAAARSAGMASLEDTGAVILETDGSMSVLPRR